MIHSWLHAGPVGWWRCAKCGLVTSSAGRIEGWHTDCTGGEKPEPVPPALDDDLVAFLRERNKALLSLDEAKIRAFVREWNGEEMPEDPETFWRAVHKARSACAGLPDEARQHSIAWLEARGSEHFGDER